MSPEYGVTYVSGRTPFQLTLEGHATLGDGVSRPYLIEATLDQDTLHANYTFGDQSGSVSMKKTGPPGRSHQAS